MSYLKILRCDVLTGAKLEPLQIYIENLSTFFIFCGVISFFAVWHTRNVGLRTSGTLEVSSEDSNINSNFFDEESDESFDSTSADIDKKFLMKNLSSLSVNDEANECEIEKKQLLDILNLMKKDENFKSTTIEELQEQLKLYRN